MCIYPLSRVNILKRPKMLLIWSRNIPLKAEIGKIFAVIY